MSSDDIFKQDSKLLDQEYDDMLAHRPKKRKRNWFVRFIRFIGRSIFYLICTCLAITGLGSVAVIGVLYFFSADLPNHTSLKEYSPLLSSRVFLQDGSKLCEYSGEKRYFVPIERIPKRLINAFVAVEDKNFYHHMGIDFLGISRSVYNNLKQLGSGKRPQGASTITQQIARIFLIKTNEVSYIRKLKEAILAYRIEQTLTKSQIMELYLNQIYLGLSCYGVATAAKIYFNKTLDELTISECAYLASLAKGANNYHPVRYKQRAIQRRNWALSRMLVNEYITQQEHDEAVKEDLVMVDQPAQDNTAKYFSEELRKYLIQKYSFGHLNQEGIIVRATLNPTLQHYACNALRTGIENTDRQFGWRGPLANIDIKGPQSEVLERLKQVAKPDGLEFLNKAVLLTSGGKILVDNACTGTIIAKDLRWAKNIKIGDVILVRNNIKDKYNIRQLPKVQGAIVVIDVHNGRILAMQGGYSFDQSEFNRVTQANRQIGSSFKPFVFLAGLENGFAPNTIIDASQVEIDLGPKLGIWKPKNYKGAIIDKITMRQALERSVNTATVRIAKEVGMHKIAEIARQFGLFAHMPEYFSYAIGAGETTLLKLTTAYAMLANGGKQITPTMVDYISDKYGKAIFKSDNRSVQYDESEEAREYPPKLNDIRPQILNEQSIYQITSLLEGVMQRGSGASARFLNFPMAGKTGTSNDSRDTWFIGYTPDIAIGVFVGFDDHTKSLGSDASGSNTALPIFIEFMKQAKPYLTPKPFRIPKGIKLRKIDAKTGGAPGDGIIITEAFKQDEDVNKDVLDNPLQNITDNTITHNTSQNEAQQVFGIY